MVSLSQLYCLSKGVRLLFFFSNSQTCWKWGVIFVWRRFISSDLSGFQEQQFVTGPIWNVYRVRTPVDLWQSPTNTQLLKIIGMIFFSAAIFINRKIQQSDVFNLPLVFFFFVQKPNGRVTAPWERSREIQVEETHRKFDLFSFRRWSRVVNK